MKMFDHLNPQQKIALASLAIIVVAVPLGLWAGSKNSDNRSAAFGRMELGEGPGDYSCTCQNGNQFNFVGDQNSCQQICNAFGGMIADSGNNTPPQPTQPPQPTIPSADSQNTCICQDGRRIPLSGSNPLACQDICESISDGTFIASGLPASAPMPSTYPTSAYAAQSDYFATPTGEAMITMPPGLNPCIQSGGTWQQFPTSCADRCEAQSGQVACLDVITESCSCPNGCWNGTSCVTTPTTTPVNAPSSGSDPIILTTDLPDALESVFYLTDISAIDTDLNDSVKVAVVNLPPGLTADSCLLAQSRQVIDRQVVSCTLEGIPQVAGSYPVQIIAADNQGHLVTKTLTLEVHAEATSFLEKFMQFFIP